MAIRMTDAELFQMKLSIMSSIIMGYDITNRHYIIQLMSIENMYLHTLKNIEFFLLTIIE